MVRHQYSEFKSHTINNKKNITEKNGTVSSTGPIVIAKIQLYILVSDQCIAALNQRWCHNCPNFHRVPFNLDTKNNFNINTAVFCTGTVIHIPFEIFHLPLSFIHFSAIQVDVFGQEDVVCNETYKANFQFVMKLKRQCKV